jgi:hypothetical protein
MHGGILDKHTLVPFLNFFSNDNHLGSRDGNNAFNPSASQNNSAPARNANLEAKLNEISKTLEPLREMQSFRDALSTFQKRLEVIVG